MKKEPKYCINCGKQIPSRNGKYCNNTCQQEYQTKQYIERWKNGEETGLSGYGVCDRVRNYILKKINFKCERCGWSEVNPFTKNIPLEIHHLDGNYLNNKEENLQGLCPNCHSLTETYKGANSGEGRKERKKYSLYE